MDLTVYVQLVFLCVVNIIFTFSGVVLNTLVIVSIWKSSQLRKKLCHFMIMVLSCFDLAVVVTSHPGLLLCVAFWLREDYDMLSIWIMYIDLVKVLTGFSFCALLVMSIERYLGAYYPIFHRTSVTKRRLLTLLAMLLIISTIFDLICINNDISRAFGVIIFLIVVFLPLLYLNFKLFKIFREVRGRKATSLEKRTTIQLHSISACLLVVACVVVLSIASIVFVVFKIISKSNQTSNVTLSNIWGTTFLAINCTFSSLIFFWKNKVLRTEGIKILKTFKDRFVRS